MDQKYYIRPPGAHTNTQNGLSYNTAWLALNHASIWTTVGPGDTLYIAGTHAPGYGQLITVGASGTAANPITIASCEVSRGASDNDPGTIYCGKRFTASTGWASASQPGVYVRTDIINISDSMVLDANHTILRKTASETECAAYENSFYWDTVGKDLYYNPGVDGLLDVFTYQGNAIDINEKSYIHIRGLSVYQGAYDGAIVVFKFSSDTVAPQGIVIDSCTMAYAVFIAIRSGGVGTQLTVTNCLIYDTPNGVYSTNNQGALFTVTDNEFYQTAQIELRDATLTNTGPFAGASSDQQAIAIQGGNDAVTIERNYIHNWHGVGIALYLSTTGSMPNIRAQRNIILLETYVEAGLFYQGMYFSGDNAGDLGNGFAGALVANNIFANARQGTLAFYYANGFYLKTGTPTNPANRPKIYNNTIYNCASGIYIRTTSSGPNSGDFKNNIVSSPNASDYAVYCENITSTAGLAFDYNCYHGASLWKWDGGADQSSLAGWQSVSSQDANSIAANPLFTTPGTDFTLQAASPCRDTGTDTGLTTDLAGNVRPVGLYDIGAYEYQSTEAQTAHPDSDISSTGWIAVPPGSYYAVLDETTPSDTDYCYTISNGNTLEVALSDFANPVSSADAHTLRYRGIGSYTTYLVQGATVIASWYVNDADYVTYERALTADQIALITDYDDLRVRFVSGS